MRWLWGAGVMDFSSIAAMLYIVVGSGLVGFICGSIYGEGKKGDRKK